MKSMIKFELKNCLLRREAIYIFAAMCLMNIIAYLITVYSYYGNPLSSIRSAFDLSILTGHPSRFLYQTFIILLPLLSALIYADSYFTDLKSGVYKQIITRTKQSDYIGAKILTVVIVTFFFTFIPLMLNQLLCLIAFPSVGFDNNFAYPAYDIGYQNYDTSYWLDLTRVQHPFLYNILFMCTASIFSVLFALWTFAISMLFPKGRLVVISSVFFLQLFYSFMVEILNVRSLSFFNFVIPLSQTTSLHFISIVLVMLVISLGIIKMRLNKEMELQEV
ncbi:hypothetical protein [Paenibacillus elgii]|uniref:hypothetical protein n=1 Tax=Paenibacillus elgii TaxID=189691 RepID=UPI0030DD519A